MANINLKFEINDNFLISYMIRRSTEKRYIPYAKDEYINDIVDFQNKAYKESSEIYYLIDSRQEFHSLLPKFNMNNFSEIGALINSYIEKISNSTEYLKLKTQTEHSLEKCEKEWRDNYQITSKLLETLGITIEEDYIVWFVHPAFRAGKYFGSHNLCWSYQTYWTNYNTIYLWHEILHSLFENNPYEHTLIELITDDHMRSILNNDNYPPFEGHTFLAEFKEEVFPIWKKYLNSQNKNIKDLVAEFKSAHEVFFKTENK